MEKAREHGKIKYLGFSFHDSYDVFQDILNYYDGWDFCQIQYNYVDLEHQAGLKGLKAAAEKGLAVVVMEPLLGGKLADPADHVKKAFPEGKSPVEYALDFLWDQRSVSLLLSGMSDERQIPEIFSFYNITAAHKEREAKAGYGAMPVKAEGCRACRRCEKECPQMIRVSQVMPQVAKVFAEI